MKYGAPEIAREMGYGVARRAGQRAKSKEHITNKIAKVKQSRARRLR
jgi:hypothetical protein